MNDYDVCIVGGGAAALGSVLALSQRFPKLKVIQIECPSDGLTKNTPATNQLSKFTPAREHQQLTASSIDTEETKIIYSNNSGGISDYWSASSFLETRELTPSSGDFFQSLGKFVEFSGRTSIWPGKFCDFLVTGETFSYVDEMRASFGDIPNVTIDHNRIAFHKSARQQLCAACGDCIYGCPSNRFFRPNYVLHRLCLENEIAQLLARVTKIEENTNGITVHTEDGKKLRCKTALLAAGVLGTPAIITASENRERQLKVFDNLMEVKFFASTKRLNIGRLGQNFGFSELAGLADDDSGTGISNFFHVSSIPQYAFDQNKILKVGFGAVYNAIMPHFFAVSFYGTKKQYRLLDIRLDSGGKWSTITTSINGLLEFDRASAKLSSNLRNKGFFEIKKNLMKTSAHYSAELSNVATSLSAPTKALRNVYVVDASTRGQAFDSHPPTLSIIHSSWTKTLQIFS